MDRNRERFFSLLRAGMWSMQPDASLFEGGETDWQCIYAWARHHAVLAWIYDGIELLPQEMRPGRAIMMKWFSVVVQIEKANEVINSRIAELVRLYSSAGIPFVLLKGQGLAACYPHPSHRQCGDIDVYVGRDNYLRANEVLVYDGGVVAEAEDRHDKHTAIKWRGVMVENHQDAARLCTPSYNRHLQTFVRDTMSSAEASFVLSGVSVRVPSPYFNSLYVLIHALVHLLSTGVGLRQICDWACVMRNHASSFDRDKWLEDMDSMGLRRPFAIFGSIAVKYLGLAPEVLPLPCDGFGEDAEFIMDDIFAAGNFGSAWNSERRVNSHPLKRKMYSVYWIAKRYFKVRSVYPVESAYRSVGMFLTGIRKFCSMRWLFH